jgi:ribosomal protein S12 methylthiotransferase
MKKVGLISLGCSKNLVDSENILGLLDHHKYQITSSIEEADIIVINTCGFISSSKKESIDTILEMVSLNKKVVVTGCLIERYYDDIKRLIPEIDLLIPIRDYYRFNALLSTLDEELNNDEGINEKYRIVSTGNFSAYLKIGEGCDNRCSYCAIPLIRGGFVSRPYQNIIDEAHFLANKGYKEIVVLQQDTTKYGVDLKNGENIVSLLKGLLEIKEFNYIRLLYLYPDEISDELIDLIASEPRLTPYFDIPIQHSESKILKSMNRRGDKQYLIDLFTKIRNKIPNAVLRTTVMVGFPGETEEDFNNLKEFIKEIKFDHLGAFTYSKEEGTASFSYPNQVHGNTKKRRLKEIMKLQQSISYNKCKTHIGEVMEGLVIGKQKDLYLFRSYWNAPDGIDGNIYVQSSKPLEVGSKIQIKITEAYVYDLYAEAML